MTILNLNFSFLLRYWKPVFLILLINLSPFPISAQEPQLGIDTDLGLPYFQEYTQEDFRGQEKYTQGYTYGIVRGPGKRMYFANLTAILEYDGREWTRIKIDNMSALSIACDSTGTVYAGGIGTFGYLQPNSKGKMEYYAIKPLNEDDDDQLYRTIFTTSHGVYFQSEKNLYRWKDASLTKCKQNSNVNLWRIFKPYDQIYAQDGLNNIYTVVNDSLQNPLFAEGTWQHQISAILPAKEKALLIVTSKNGLFIYKDGQLRKLPTEVDDFIRESEIYKAVSLDSNLYVLGGYDNGAVLIDANGKLLQKLDRNLWQGDSDNIYALYADEDQNTWIGLSSGIIKLDTSLPISVFDKRKRLPGNVMVVTRFQNQLIAGTTTGTYILQERSPNNQPQFKLLAKNLTNECHALLPVGSSLFIDNGAAVYIYQNGIVKKIFAGTGLSFHQSQIDSNLVFVGTWNKIGLIYRNNGKWTPIDKMITTNINSLYMAEGQKGRIWLGTNGQGVSSISPMADSQGKIEPKALWKAYLSGKVENYNQENGAASSGEFYVFDIDGSPLFATQNGLRKFDAGKNQFLPNKILGENYTLGKRNVYTIAKDAKGGLWFHSENENFRAILQPDNSYTIDSTSLRRIPYTQVNHIFPEKSGIVWLASNYGLIRYDNRVPRSFSKNDSIYSALINHVTLNGGDTTLVEGSHFKQSAPVSVKYSRNTIRFEYATPFFENEENNGFKYKLDGFDENWSKGWPTESVKEYTDLWEGDYTFQVKAQNIYSLESGEATFHFKILPPWYRSWWAYVLYGIIGVAVIILFVRRQVKLAEKRQRERYREREINAARKIQFDSMPKAPPEISGYTIGGFCLPAFDVGGDHFDYVKLDNGDVMIVLVDVEGKQMKGAIPSIMVNSMIKMALQNYNDTDIRHICEVLNSQLIERFDRSVSVSLIIGCLNVQQNRFEFINAGCPSPVKHSEKHNTPAQIADKDFSPAIGILDIEQMASHPVKYYKKHHIDLEKGDMLLLFSDGVAEIQNKDGRFFVHKVQDFMDDLPEDHSATQICDRLRREITGMNHRKANDDQTLVLLKRDNV